LTKTLNPTSNYYSTARQLGLIKELIRTCKFIVDVGNIGKSNWDVLTLAVICKYWFNYCTSLKHKG